MEWKAVFLLTFAVILIGARQHKTSAKQNQIRTVHGEHTEHATRHHSSERVAQKISTSQRRREVKKPKRTVEFRSTECGWEHNIGVGDQGIITSPSFPYSYGDNLDCYWNINAPEAHFVHMELLYLQLESCDKCDLLELMATRDDGFNWGYSYTEIDGVQDYFSFTNNAVVQFQTDHGAGSTGFALSYRTVAASKCRRSAIPAHMHYDNNWDTDFIPAGDYITVTCAADEIFVNERDGIDLVCDEETGQWTDDDYPEEPLIPCRKKSVNFCIDVKSEDRKDAHRNTCRFWRDENTIHRDNTTLDLAWATDNLNFCRDPLNLGYLWCYTRSALGDVHAKCSETPECYRKPTESTCKEVEKQLQYDIEYADTIEHRIEGRTWRCEPYEDEETSLSCDCSQKPELTATYNRNTTQCVPDQYSGGYKGIFYVYLMPTPAETTDEYLKNKPIAAVENRDARHKKKHALVHTRRAHQRQRHHW